MPKRKKVFFDVKFNEWLFNQLVNLTPEQRQTLNANELRKLRNKTAVRAFVNMENLEKLLSICTKVGIEWNLSFFESGFKIGPLVHKAYRQYSIQGKPAEVIDEMFLKKIFVINSRDVAISMAIMSVNCHSENYIINPHFYAFNRNMRQLKSANISNMLTNQNDEHNDVLRGTQKLAKLVSEALAIDDYLSAQFNLQPLDASILWLLYQTPYNYVSVDYIKSQLRSKYKPSSVGLRCAQLFKDKHMLDKRPASEGVISYLISAEGVIAVGMINNYLINKVYG